MSKWDERYAEEGWTFGTEPNAFLRASARHIPPGRVLSFCEGEGRNGVFLAGLGYEVVGVDSSEVGLAKARRLARERGVEIGTVRMDLEEYVVEPSSWSGIVSIFCHVPSELRRRLHREVVEGLLPGGVFILEAHTPDQMGYDSGGPSDPDRLPTLEMLREELAGLEMILGREVVREVEEGSHHEGMMAVVQVVAVRPTSVGPG